MDLTLSVLQSHARESSRQIMMVKDTAMDALNITSDYLSSIHLSILDAASDRVLQMDILDRIAAMQSELDAFIANLGIKRMMINVVPFFLALTSVALCKEHISSASSGLDPVLDERTFTCYIPHFDTKGEYLPRDIFKYNFKDDKWYLSNKAGPLSTRGDAFQQVNQIPDDVLTARDKICKEFILKDMGKARGCRHCGGHHHHHHHSHGGHNHSNYAEEKQLKLSKKYEGDRKRRVCKWVCTDEGSMDESPLSTNLTTTCGPTRKRGSRFGYGTKEVANISTCPCQKAKLEQSIIAARGPTRQLMDQEKGQDSTIALGGPCTRLPFIDMTTKPLKTIDVPTAIPYIRNISQCENYSSSTFSYDTLPQIQLPRTTQNATTQRAQGMERNTLNAQVRPPSTVGCSSCAIKNDIEPLSTPLAKKIIQDFKERNARLQETDESTAYSPDDYSDDDEYEDEDEDIEDYEDEE